MAWVDKDLLIVVRVFILHSSSINFLFAMLFVSNGLCCASYVLSIWWFSIIVFPFFVLLDLGCVWSDLVRGVHTRTVMHTQESCGMCRFAAEAWRRRAGSLEHVVQSDKFGWGRTHQANSLDNQLDSRSSFLQIFR